MSKNKNSLKSKFVMEDISAFLNESQFLKESSKNKKPQKRQRTEPLEDNSITVGNYPSSAKNKKIDNHFVECGESKKKLFDVISRQLESRKQTNDTLLKCLSEVLAGMEADQNIFKDSEQKLENVMKCMQQANSAHKRKFKALKEIYASFQKECQEMEAEHKIETDQLGNELEEDIKKLQQKLVAETKRSGWETLRRTIFQAMQNDF